MKSGGLGWPVMTWTTLSWPVKSSHWPVMTWTTLTLTSHWLVMTQGLSSSSQPSQWPVMTDFRFYRCRISKFSNLIWVGVLGDQTPNNCGILWALGWVFIHCQVIASIHSIDPSLGGDLESFLNTLNSIICIKFYSFVQISLMSAYVWTYVSETCPNAFWTMM